MPTPGSKQGRLIQNFGLFWNRELVDWGRRGRGNLGHLWGYASKPGANVDFREQRGVYVLYEGDSIPTLRAVYVGQAGARDSDLFHRLRNHRDGPLWNRWQLFSWFGFLAVGTAKRLIHRSKVDIGNIPFPTALDQVEAVVMALLEPSKNRQGPRWRGATEYFQFGTSAADAANGSAQSGLGDRRALQSSRSLTRGLP